MSLWALEFGVASRGRRDENGQVGWGWVIRIAGYLNS